MSGKSRARIAAEEEARSLVQEAMGTMQSRYVRAFDRRAHGYALVGYTNEEIADLIGVERNTFARWLVDHPSLAISIQKARVDDHVRVVRSVHRAANGFRHKETKLHVINNKVRKTDVTRVYPPSMDAARLLLTNRQGDRWKDKSGGDSGNTLNLSLILERAGLGEDAKPVAGELIEAKPAKTGPER